MTLRFVNICVCVYIYMNMNMNIYEFIERKDQEHFSLRFFWLVRRDTHTPKHTLGHVCSVWTELNWHPCLDVKPMWHTAKPVSRCPCDDQVEVKWKASLTLSSSNRASQRKGIISGRLMWVMAVENQTLQNTMSTSIEYEYRNLWTEDEAAFFLPWWGLSSFYFLFSNSSDFLIFFFYRLSHMASCEHDLANRSWLRASIFYYSCSLCMDGCMEISRCTLCPLCYILFSFSLFFFQMPLQITESESSFRSEAYTALYVKWMKSSWLVDDWKVSCC